MSRYVTRLAAQQLASYRAQPIDLISHFNHERNISDAYRGRQLLELIQNADDAGDGFAEERRLLVRLTDGLLIVANSGHPFSEDGIQSLIVSDVSPKKLSRSRFIGNKGLGFRSVLTWSRAPAVFSGPFAVSFSKDRAVTRTLELAV
ncbi:MAG: sacsin N-terminal ATP-binding-like domain-containing protein, partial [Longimicrobiales bacterium]